MTDVLEELTASIITVMMILYQQGDDHPPSTR
jgi:hypothetical protein